MKITKKKSHGMNDISGLKENPKKHMKIEQPEWFPLKQEKRTFS